MGLIQERELLLRAEAIALMFPADRGSSISPSRNSRSFRIGIVVNRTPCPASSSNWLERRRRAS